MKLGFSIVQIVIFLALFVSTQAFADLIVIDMQPFFLKRGGISEQETENLIKSIIRKIEKAKKNEDYIIFVEYKADRFHSDRTYNLVSSTTHPDLLKLVAEYKKVLKVTKDQDNGSLAIKQLLDQNGLVPDSLDICGVNTGFCVKSTVEGLTKAMDGIKKISIDSESCRDGGGEGFHYSGLRYMSFLPKVGIEGKYSEFGNPILKFRFSDLDRYLESEPFDVMYVAAAYGMLEGLLKFGYEQDLPIRSWILRLFKNPDLRVRSTLAIVLGAIRPKNVELHSFLSRLLNDTSGDVRASAARALGDIGTIDPLIHRKLSYLLDDPVSEVRSSAALSLGCIQFRNSVILLNPYDPTKPWDPKPSSKSKIMQFSTEIQERREFVQYGGDDKSSKIAKDSLELMEHYLCPPNLVSPDCLNPFGLLGGEFSIPASSSVPPRMQPRPLITPLIAAVRFGTLEMVENELRRDVDVNQADLFGTDALHYAEFRGEHDIILSLLRSGQILEETILDEVAYLKGFIRGFPQLDNSGIKRIITLFKKYLKSGKMEKQFLSTYKAIHLGEEETPQSRMIKRRVQTDMRAAVMRYLEQHQTGCGPTIDPVD